MGKKRVLVGYGIDVDAVANWINTCDGSPQNPTNVSRGIYGATVGIDRLLKLYDKYGIKVTFFTPAHSIDSQPSNSFDVLTRSIDVLTKFCGGQKPMGYTAPAWSTSKELILQLEAEGILYDHSLMHYDVQPYFAPDSSERWTETNHAKSRDARMMPISKIRPSKVVEIPANWHLDDWPPLQPIPGRPVEKLWMEEFDFAYKEYETFIFPLSIHPQVSGKPHVILMHERIIEHINKHEGVEWMPLGGMAKEFLEGRMPGVEVEGDVDP